MGWWLNHNWLGSLLFPWSLTVVSFPGCDVLSSESYTWSRVILPTSQFMVLFPFCVSKWFCSHFCVSSLPQWRWHFINKSTKLNVHDIMELLEFILTTTYFSFRNNIYRQKFGAAMGSPVSGIIANNMFMERLEKEAIASAPMDCRLKLWWRYVNDELEVIKGGTSQKLTDHLNTVDNGKETTPQTSREKQWS